MKNEPSPRRNRGGQGMTIREAKRLLVEAIYRGNECQQPFHCKWHNRFSTDLERCPYAGQGKCDCHEYARALRTLVSHLNRRRPCARLPNRTARKP